jgi:hypothetical protein
MNIGIHFKCKMSLWFQEQMEIELRVTCAASGEWTVLDEQLGPSELAIKVHNNSIRMGDHEKGKR